MKNEYTVETDASQTYVSRDVIDNQKDRKGSSWI